MKRLPYVLSAVLLSVAIGTAAWMGRSRYDLWFAERGLNEFYRQHRPFAYRWPGTPYEVQGPPVLSENAHKQLDGISLRLDLWRDKLASDVHWLRLRGRVALLDGNYDRAVTQYRRARLLSRNDPSITAELAVAYALRAVAEKRATDYGAALNYAAEAASGKTPPSFTLFNLAVLTEDIPLPRVALEQWQAAGAAEEDSAWRTETAAHRNQLAGMLETRQRNRDALHEPASIRAPVADLPGALEVIQQEALQNWVLLTQPPRASLEFLAREFSKHKDNWWQDFLSVPLDRNANTLLSQTLTANTAGLYADAEKTGEQAEAAYRRAGNIAGRLRARRERLEASHRGDNTHQCSSLLVGVAGELSARHYPWLAGQITLDEITCRTVELQGASLDDRIGAFSDIEKTGFAGITLRALAFLAEPWVSAGSPLTAWTRAQQGLPQFWSSVLDGYRAFHFSYNLAEASALAGYNDGARVLMHEAALNLALDPNLGLRAAILGVLAQAEARAGHHDEAARDLIEARTLSARTQTQRYNFDLEIEHANAELFASRPTAALQRLDAVLAVADPLKGALNPMSRVDLLNEKGVALLQMKRYAEAERTFRQLVTVHGAVFGDRKARLEHAAVARRYDAAFRGFIDAQINTGKFPAASLSSWVAFRSGIGETPWDSHLVPKDGAYLAFAILPSGISAWLADSRGVEQHWIAQGPVQELAGRLAGLAADPEVPETTIRALAREAEVTLLSPFRDRLPAAKSGVTPELLIDADGVLQKIPWALLENEKGKSLIERYSLVQAMGRMWVQHDKQRPITQASRALVLADPALDPADDAFPPLKDAWAEGRRVASRFHSVDFVSGKQATAATFAAGARRAEVLHFAGHGVSNGGMGGLLMSGQPKFLTAEQISGLPLSTLQLVVLSSCSSGVAEDTSSVDSDLLMRSFLDAGAARVLASSWTVDSLATGRLMDLFYTNLLLGNTPAGALREAILELRSHPVGAHPSAWAAFQLYGQP